MSFHDTNDEQRNVVLWWPLSKEHLRPIHEKAQTSGGILQAVGSSEQSIGLKQMLFCMHAVCAHRGTYVHACVCM